MTPSMKRTCFSAPRVIRVARQSGIGDRLDRLVALQETRDFEGRRLVGFHAYGQRA